MDTQEDVVDIVMKVEVEENPLKLPEDIEQEVINESQKIEDSINKLREYKNAKDDEYDKKVEATREKLNIAQNVIQACNSKIPLNVTPIDKLHKYTKLPISELVGVINEDVPKMSLKIAIKDTEKIPSYTTTFIYNDIREVFIECYVRMRQMPSVADLLDSLCAMRDEVLYIYLSITRLVTNKLVKYHYFPKFNSYILTENPEFSYKRHLYLKQILQYRRQSASIVYVAVLNLPLVKSANYLFLAASSQGLISKFSYIQSVNILSMENQVKVWIQHELIPKMSTSAIVVLMQPQKPDPTPTIHSSRTEMTQWLEDHFVPHDNTSHTSDLYNLIKLSKKHFKVTGYYEELLASAGFKVLVCPNEYPNLNFFNTIQTHAIENDTVKEVSIVKMISRNEWRQMEEQLIEMEKQILEEDAEMDKIIENLFQMVKSGDLKEEDFPDNCRASKADNFAVHIADIIID